MLPRLERGITSQVIARLREIDPALAVGTLSEFKLGQVKDFTLAAAAQHSGVPIWEVRQGDRKQLEAAEKVFLEIARLIIQKV